MPDHSPEPWGLAPGTNANYAGARAGDYEKYRQKCFVVHSEDSNTHFVADLVVDTMPIGQANAERIVACVNVCEGMSTEQLQAILDGELGMHLLEPQTLKDLDQAIGLLSNALEKPTSRYDDLSAAIFGDTEPVLQGNLVHKNDLAWADITWTTPATGTLRNGRHVKMIGEVWCYIDEEEEKDE